MVLNRFIISTHSSYALALLELRRMILYSKIKKPAAPPTQRVSSPSSWVLVPVGRGTCRRPYTRSRANGRDDAASCAWNSGGCRAQVVAVESLPDLLVGYMLRFFQGSRSRRIFRRVFQMNSWMRARLPSTSSG